ncbi:low molecular weight protein-tyrosine-phosphatase [Pseudomonas typographi]|uniref:low molecular weight protein-tyrosine-phosphatase n=1 Tax=Pseudomonas typographi TaxID=2715964 RepID=UPI001688DACC|nr:low molecular weight protein-tyrosine-phosphatase [Pseudomonas typographi]MBD1588901.1 low molecular weight phosphotyrosine protein phosphatase [Pseudomonas typographi]
MRILFVCLGNICRSPTAEGVMRQKLAKAGLGQWVQVASAGTGDWHVGKAPDTRTQAAARQRGYELAGQRAQQVKAADFDHYDLILAMDHANLAQLERLRPTANQTPVALFLRYTGGPVDDVPDPYYGGSQGFEQVLALIEAGCDQLVAELGGQP